MRHEPETLSSHECKECGEFHDDCTCDEPEHFRCDQCEALMINGMFCHEIGCPNTHARYDEESDTWIRQYKCRECGYMVDKGESCDCQREEDLPALSSIEFQRLADRYHFTE